MLFSTDLGSGSGGGESIHIYLMAMCILRYCRYRFTAALISILLIGGLASPHYTINKVVERLTGFKPTDGNEWTCQEDESLVNSKAIEVMKSPFGKMSESLSLLYFQSLPLIPSLIDRWSSTLATCPSTARAGFLRCISTGEY
jgi:hypothetical protein